MTGPFVVTVKRGEDVVSRRAVADRSELELTISRLLDGTDSPATRFRARQVVGGDRPGEIPLPDGTVIEVERVDFEPTLVRRGPGDWRIWNIRHPGGGCGNVARGAGGGWALACFPSAGEYPTRRAAANVEWCIAHNAAQEEPEQVAAAA